MNFKSRFVFFCSIVTFISNTFSAIVLPHDADTQAVDQHVLSSLVDEATDAYNQSSLPIKRNIYAIAHRVLTVQGITDAINDGANALEIDVTSWWRNQPEAPCWYADNNSPSGPKIGDSIETIFKTIARQRQLGKTVTFVWLDVKNPDYCDVDNPTYQETCAISALQILARKYLVSESVQVLYGFDKAGYKGYKFINDHLGTGEGISLDGKTDDVLQQFQGSGPLEKSFRAMSRGMARLDRPATFGNCDPKIIGLCGQLRKAVQTNQLGMVFGWTNGGGQRHYVEKLLDMGIDGMMYGFPTREYRSTPKSRAAFNDIKHWVDKHSSDHQFAPQ